MFKCIVTIKINGIKLTLKTNYRINKSTQATKLVVDLRLGTKITGIQFMCKIIWHVIMSKKFKNLGKGDDDNNKPTNTIVKSWQSFRNSRNFHPLKEPKISQPYSEKPKSLDLFWASCPSYSYDNNYEEIYPTYLNKFLHASHIQENAHWVCYYTALDMILNSDTT